MSKCDEIQKFNTKYLNLLTERCLKECGRLVSLFHFPVFKKFVDERVKKDLSYYRLCLDLALSLNDKGSRVSREDIDDLLDDAKDIDKKFINAISYLPLRLTMDYEKIDKFRRERTVLLVNLYLKLLKRGNEKITYKEMVKGSYKKKEFIELNNNLLDLYAEETFIINSSLRTIIPMDVNAMANRLYCTMQDMGRGLNTEVANEIYEKKL
ncbi:MAG: hypothetical protein HZA09_02230 [Nitrospirae bacterium]|nr:hypothetical protein [Nitrospirota bacterium]